jgi:hypothetical protein
MLKKAAIIFTFGFVFFTVAGLNSCSIKYSFTGANISPNIKAFSVAFFTNRAKLVNPNLSQQLTESLKEKLMKQTPYNEISDGGDLEFSGTITDYNTRPIAIQKEDVASQSRLTITINLKYTDNKDHEQDFEKSFSAFEDYDGQKMLSDVEDELVKAILEKLLEDIFNATIAKW